ncbi:hypothetical protein ACFY00_31695 [Kitasatospora sp. NPDC001540]|uniref:hypothetical protein n=1 Tax=Kitasatospora sp. NPDC001540 TaxID=3364014 RepID=UPI0036A5DADB
MPRPPAPPLTPDVARELLRLTRAEIGPGLTGHELDAVEERYGFRFAADHRVLLSAGLPLGSRAWPDWRGGDPADLRSRLDAPVEGVLFDVGNNAFWHPGWGPRPADPAQALRVARAELADVPPLVPVYGHRYLPGTAGESGHPVLSVHQTDIIHYGNDLADYLRHEFGRGPYPVVRARSTVDFWTYLVEDGSEGWTTPHDPYATTAEEAVEHLRMLALELLVGRDVDEWLLAQAGLAALVLGVEAPSLAELAGLPVEEAARIRELFGRVLAELGIADALPADDTDLSWEAARWELVRWWLRLITNGTLRPRVGAEVIAYGGWADLARPAALTSLVGLTDPAEITAEAERLLAGPWPPHPR